MSRTCESCGRSWRGSATFCGACGDLLPDAMAATVVRTADGRPDRRGPILAVALGVAVLAGAAAVPSLTVDRTPPVNGEIGVPATGDLQAAPSGTTPRREAPGPDLSCSRDDEPVDCIVWERDLVGPPDPDGHQAWPMVAGDHILLVGAEDVEGVDAHSGTRRWRIAEPVHSFPVGIGDAVAVLEGGASHDVRVVDLASGQVRWRTSGARGLVQGDLLHGDLVLTASDPDEPPAVVARDADDGTERWRWPTPWPWLQATGIREDRLLLSPASDADGLAILDPTTGTEVATSTVRTSWWMRGVVDDTVVLAEPLEPDGASGGDLAGDGGAVLRGVALEDGTVRWERQVPAGQVQFGLAQGVVLAPSTGTVRAVAAATGELAWDIPLEPGHELAHHGPIGFEGSAEWDRVAPIVATGDRAADVVRGLDPATGAPRWEHALDGDLQHVAVTPDVVWVGLHDGFVVLDPGTGQERVRVHGVEASPVHPFSLDPLLLFHHPSGSVLRLDPDMQGTG